MLNPTTEEMTIDFRANDSNADMQAKAREMLENAAVNYMNFVSASVQEFVRDGDAAECLKTDHPLYEVETAHGKLAIAATLAFTPRV